MLEKIDLSVKIPHDAYEALISKTQLRLLNLQVKMREKGIPMVVIYEGWDASGKGGSIMRIVEQLDPRGYRVIPIGAPTETERCHHYLWRFWINLPGCGQLAIFDRSWYGRVLVERVEKYATKAEWRRAYREIREFERMLIDGGCPLVKFWLHISQDEQLRRFKERENNPYKRWKIGPDDWRNREKWDDYAAAAEEMFAETDTPESPWHLIPADSKHYARVETARIVADTLEAAVKQRNGKKENGPGQK